MKLKCGNTIIFANRFGAMGDSTGHHSHSKDGHTTICIEGSLRLERWMDGLDKESEILDIPKGGFAYIEKDVIHNVTALEDDSAYMCVWSKVVNEDGVALPGQEDGFDPVEIDVWNKLSEAPWLSY